jgi:RHH-type proline utilization regulon transcriptional repressor/proline dehydrogenase/delta 1-pyrroline-5-carboxylate dehydrogenase
VKWGVRPSSYTFRNELFAPLLSVVCIDSLEQGIEYANSSEYGLTAGLQSLNKAERELWKNKIEAGNLYINRGITGAIVRRQPFGGMKRSAFGGGIKAGGPNYVASFLRFKNATAYDIKDVEANYRQAWNNVFSKEEDVSHIYGEENTFRYLPLKSMALRIADGDALNDALLVMLAANQTKTKLTVRLSDKHHQLEVIKAKVATFDGMKLRLESEEDFINTMSTYERIRTCSESLSDAVYQKAAELGLCIIDSAPLAEGRIELLHYLKEQSISFEYHRYGSIFEENKCCG